MFLVKTAAVAAAGVRETMRARSALFLYLMPEATAENLKPLTRIFTSPATKRAGGPTGPLSKATTTTTTTRRAGRAPGLVGEPGRKTCLSGMTTARPDKL
jgi:hypothetical protein